MFFLAAVAPGMVFAQCPVHFRNEAAASLATGAGSHYRVARQIDGAYTGYEIADAKPYGLLRAAPRFDERLTSCGFTNSVINPSLPEAIARLNSGNYLYVAYNITTPPQPGPSIRAVLFDSGFQFLSETDYAVNGQLQLADLNGDGNPEIIAGQQFSRNAGIAVLLGRGGTNFDAPEFYGTAALLNIVALAVGDLDGDGKPDVVAAGVGRVLPGSHIWVLYGKGDGTLEEPVSLASAWGDQGVAIGDVNRDGIPDLAFTVGSPPNGNADYVMVMLGRGGRGFTEPTPYPTGGSGAVAIGDVDGDGNSDVVTNGVTVYFGDGKGGFPRRKDWFNDAPGAVILTDFNADGRTDIVIGSGSAAALVGDRVAVIYNLGGGDFSGAPVSAAYSLNYPVLALQSADLNVDGIPDVVITGLSQCMALLGDGDGTFRQTWELEADYHLVLGDFNGDGRPDLVTQTRQSGPNLTLLLGKGDGTFQQSTVSPLPQPLNQLGAGDFNGDGKLDLAALLNGPGDAGNVVIYLGDGKGAFGPPSSYAVGLGARAIAVADLNRDGRADIAVAAAGEYQMNNGEITVLLSVGNGFTRSAIPMGSELPYGLTAADLNGDRVPDLAVQFATGRAATLLGRGDGRFGDPVFLAERAQPGTYSVVGFAAADLDGDGRTDLVGWGGNPGIWLGRGDGTFAAQISLPQYFAPFVALDFAGNRRPDLAMGDWLTGVAVFLNQSLPWPRRGR